MTNSENPAAAALREQIEEQRARVEKADRSLMIEQGILRQLELAFARLAKLAPTPRSGTAMSAGLPMNGALTSPPMPNRGGMTDSPRARRKDAVIHFLADGAVGPTALAEAVSTYLGEKVTPMNIQDILRTDTETFVSPERGKWCLRSAARAKGGAS